MKISFPTDDRKTIAKRTGRAKEFLIYEIEDRQIINVDYKENTHKHQEHGQGHDHHKGGGGHTHEEIMELLSDVDLLVVGRVGKFMKKELIDSKINYHLTKNFEIEEALKEYLSAL